MTFPGTPPLPSAYKKDPLIIKDVDRISLEDDRWIFVDNGTTYQFNYMLDQWVPIKDKTEDKAKDQRAEDQRAEEEEEQNKEELRRIKRQKIEQMKKERPKEHSREHCRAKERKGPRPSPYKLILHNMFRTEEDSPQLRADIVADLEQECGDGIGVEFVDDVVEIVMDREQGIRWKEKLHGRWYDGQKIEVE